MSKIKVSKQIMGKKLAGEEWVFLNLRNGVYYGLNETGSLFWDQLAKHQCPEKAVDELCKIFDRERPQIERDMQALLRALNQEGMIELAKEEM